MKTRLLRIFRKLGVSLVSPRVFYAGAMVLLGAISIGILIWWLVSREQTQQLVLLSGQAGGTYRPLAEKIATLIEGENDRLEIEVRDSEGSITNLRRVAAGGESTTHVLGIIQNDVAIPPDWENARANTVRSLLPLHSGGLHFIVPADSVIHSIADLRGRIVATGLQNSGSPALAEALLAHYGISLDAVDRRHLSLPEACEELREGEVDAILMTMGLKSAEFEQLIDDVPVRLVGIGENTDPGSEIEGFRLTYPFVRSAYIPKYAYRAPEGQREGVPNQAVPTIELRAVLVANRNLPNYLAMRIARTLVENKSSLSRSHPSAAQITEHFDPAQLQFPIHEGAHRYFHRDDPGFLRRNADLLGFILSLFLALWGFLHSTQRWMTQRRKDRIDAYYIELDKILDPLYHSDSNLQDLEKIEVQLLEIQRRAVRLLASERLVADESFRIFQDLLSEGRQEVEKRMADLGSIETNGRKKSTS